ncbi:MAG: peptidase M48, partial [Alphaproteobacteria bacterium]
MTATRTIALLLALPVLAGLMSGCTRNPATGSPVFTGGLTAAEERQIGRENHPKIVEEFSGEYSFQDLQAYVEGLGQKLARISDRKEINFRFTLLNSDIINAFAVPGGYIYVT